MFEKITLREKILLSVCIILFITVAFGGRGLDYVDAKTSDPDIYKELQVFSEVLSIVQSDFVTKPESEKLVSGAIKGMLTTLDPHSTYLGPDGYKELETQTKGEFGGLGIEITMRDDAIVIVSPMEGSPAHKAGIKSGDIIIKVDGVYTKDFNLNEVVSKLRGAVGSSVTISVQRKGVGTLLDYTIVRDIVKIKSIRKRFLGDGYGYIRIAQFMDNTANDLKQALDALKKSNNNSELKGLIIDVRNNPGGLLTQAIRVSDIFLKEGVIVYTEGRLQSQKQKFYASDSNNEPSYPIIILINGGSASAAEILAAAFKDHGRAIVLGEQSFGKGSVQTVTPLGNGGAVTLTTALYYTKSGNSIQAKGVSPDVEVLQKDEDSEEEILKHKSDSGYIRESDLPGAINNPNGEGDILKKINKTPTISEEKKILDPETTKIEEWLNLDAQFKKALELIKTY